MKFFWIAGRFLFLGLILATTIVSMGGSSPLSTLSLILGQQEPAASSPAVSNAWTEDAQEPIGKAEDLVGDWDKPTFALFVSGRQHGYIEPCGCITLARQKGGLMRRHAVQTILEDRGWDLVNIDAGNQVRRFGQQPVIKLRKTYQALCQVMNYDVVGIGPDDLKLPPAGLAQTMDMAKLGDKNPFTCANAEILDASFTNKFVVIEKNGKRIGVTMVLGDEHIRDFPAAPMLTTTSAEAGLRAVVPQLEAAKCDMKVLIAFASPANCRKLAKQFPVFDVLVTAGGAGDPTLEPEVVEAGNKSTSMIQVGVKGMYVGLIAFYEENGVARIKYERVPLDHRYVDSPKIKEIFKSYQEELKDLWDRGLLNDITPQLHPSGYSFLGSETCAGCHDEEYAIWEDGVDGDGGPHAKATKSLEQNPNDDRVWVQRQYDPECISCHATGWNPQNFYPYVSGYFDFKKDVHLYANGCENCHGPGSAHVELQELKDKGLPHDEKLLRKTTLEMRSTLADARASACKECHDLDNSPDFLLEGGFDKYWPKIKHGRTAIKKVQDLLDDVVQGKKPASELASLNDLISIVEEQNPDQVVVLREAIELLRREPGQAILIAKNTLNKLN